MKRSKEESLAIATKSLMWKEVFYGMLLMQMNKEWTDKVLTSGVAKNGINYSLYINPLFWESLTDIWQLMVLKFDALQIAFHHVEIGANYADQDICGLATNIVCNQYIDPSWLPLFDVKWKDYVELNKELFELWRRDISSGKMTKEEAVEQYRKVPPRGVYLQDFPELNLEPLKGLKYYYDKLLEAKGKPVGKGGCAALNELLKNKEDELPEGWSHDWSEFEGMSEAEKKLLRSQTDHILREVAEQVKKLRGTIPSELAGYIEALDKKDPPKFDWRRYLRRFAGGSRKVYTKKLHRKYNKRFEDLPGLKIKPKRHIMVAVDTSGSVSNMELKEFFHEIYHMHKMGSDVTVVQCDAAISSVAPYKRGDEDRIKITGRGGTDFNDPVRYFNEHKKDFSCMIYLTDGECPPPTEKIQGRMLWVLSSKSNRNDDLKPQIKLN